MMVTKLESKPTWVNRWEVTSRTDPTKTYVVGQKSDGSWGCACPRWIFSKERPRPDCKHILRIKSVEPVDNIGVRPTARDFQRARVAARAALPPIGFTEQERKRAEARAIAETPQPVFLLQTRRSIQLED